MSNPAAFQATFHKAIPVVSRGTIQIVFEVSSEMQAAALNVLGGMVSRPGESDWFEIKRVDLNAGERHGMDPSPATGGEVGTPAGDDLPARPNQSKMDKLRKPVAPEKRLAQQAGICCADPVFRKFLAPYRDITENEAALCVRDTCGVNSRSEIIPDTPAGIKWQQIYNQFRMWCDAPELAAS